MEEGENLLVEACDMVLETVSGMVEQNEYENNRAHIAIEGT